MVLSFFLGVIKDVQDEMLKGEKSGQIFAVIHIGMKHLATNGEIKILKYSIMNFIISNKMDIF